jgi:hypothetical protein
MSMSSRGDPLPWRFVVHYRTALLLAARRAARTAGYRRTARPGGRPVPGWYGGFSSWPSHWAASARSRPPRWGTVAAPKPTARSPSSTPGCGNPGSACRAAPARRRPGTGHADERSGTQGPAWSRDHVAEKGWAGSHRAGSLQPTVTPSEEVRPMNAVSMWVLPLAVTAGRLT